tara:strand:- start:2619 stop:3581 length:963 start_codon:yes stop_codon:yes gene_type:complete
MSFKIVSQVFLYISLLAFIIFRYKTKAILNPNSKVSENTAVIFLGVFYALITIVNMYFLKSNPILSALLFISTCIIMYSVVKNISSSPILENLIIGAQNEDNTNDDTPQVDMDIANLRINIEEFYNNKVVSKTIMTLIMYTLAVYSVWFGLWKGNCPVNDLLCDNNFVFVALYFSFSLFVLLDMFRNTKDFGFFDYDDNEKNDVIFNNNWVLYSVFYSFYLVYVLIISQSVRNAFNGLAVDKSFNFAGLIALILTIIHFIQYYRLQKAREECDCYDAQISVLDNNIKVFHFNCLLLPIVLIIVATLSPKAATSTITKLSK